MASSVFVGSNVMGISESVFHAIMWLFVRFKLVCMLARFFNVYVHMGPLTSDSRSTSNFA